MKKTIHSLCFDAIFLALLCVSAGLSIPLGTLKISLQLFIIFIFGLIIPYVKDLFIVTISYALLSLFLPLCAGYVVGLGNPTYGFVIGFILGAFLMKVTDNICSHYKMKKWIKDGISCISCLVGVYLTSIIYMLIFFQYKQMNISFLTIIVSYHLPYLLIDIIKGVLAIQISHLLQPIVKRIL